MKKTLKFVIFGGAVAALVGCGMTVLKSYEEPNYELVATLQKEPHIEQRRYAPKLMAQVEVSGEREQAINDGFRLLADFIFGNNTAKTSIDMTTPVAQQSASKTIDMTTPVAQQASGDGSWKVQFFMPKQYTMDTLPMPNNDKVQIKMRPGFEAVVIRFSGSQDGENLKKHQQMIEDYIAQHNLVVVADPTYAFYDPPWTPWFIKRNEIIYTLVSGS